MLRKRSLRRIPRRSLRRSSRRSLRRSLRNKTVIIQRVELDLALYPTNSLDSDKCRTHVVDNL